jgi:glycosyltransferase involved in cell wall biosynthesis
MLAKPPPELEERLKGVTISVVLCTLNEALNLRKVLVRIPSWIRDVLLVDAHSTDGTVETARQIRPDIRILYQPSRGKDEALKFGVREARGDIVVTMDSDGENAPEDLARFIAPLFDSYDFVKGSRFFAGWRSKPVARLFGNWTILTIFNALYGTRFSDICSGYNAFWKARTFEVKLWSGQGWYYEPRIIAVALRRGLRVVEVGQTYYGRIHGQSKLPNWWQGLSAIWYVFFERFRVARS